MCSDFPKIWEGRETPPLPYTLMHFVLPTSGLDLPCAVPNFTGIPAVTANPHTQYTGDAGCAITTGIPVKFGTAHGLSRPEVGSSKRIDVYGSGGVSRPSLIIGNS